MALQLRMHLGSTKTYVAAINRFPQMSVWSAFWGTNCGTDAVWIFAVQCAGAWSIERSSRTIEPKSSTRPRGMSGLGQKQT